MPTASDVPAYYRAALAALRFVERRRPTGRRFGSEADARWNALKGDLETSDRIDMLIRDANAEWPGAFGARAVFRFDQVSEDDPFGAHWEPFDPVDGEDLWAETLDAPEPMSLGAALDAVAGAWNIEIAPFGVGTIDATDRVLVAGPSAIAATVAAFAESSELDWHRQVEVVATTPGPRQLAALAPAWLNVNRPVRIIAADAPVEKLGKRRALVSDDASADDRRWTTTLAGEKA